MHSNFRLTKWNIYKATFKVILINVPFAWPARCSKMIRRPYLQLELVKLPIAAGVLAAVKILVQRMATCISRASSSDPSAGWGTGTWATPALHSHCWTKGAIWAQTRMEMEYSLSYWQNNPRRAPNIPQLNCKHCGASLTAAVNELWLYPHPEPAPQHWEAAQKDSPHPSAARRWNFPTSQLIQHRICQSHWTASSSAPQPSQLSNTPACSPWIHRSGGWTTKYWRCF